MNDQLYLFLKQYDKPDLSPSSWKATLMDAVYHYNNHCRTRYDELETFLLYVKRKESEAKRVEPV
ncbi:hypothetical protein [Endozoicomonas atrinae]|uniref:hypothetical protein n=1 Tax=Endozoicomonas atrinae TaxID=1333660 RepID=UPI0008246748|nr:hypothetical protein [Endozoicomonas atrinae]